MAIPAAASDARTFAERTRKSLPLVTKGRWHGEAVTEWIRTDRDRQPTIPQSACG